MKSDGLFSWEVNPSGISVISGTRPAGRQVEQGINGRSFYGFLYIWEGRADFFQADGKEIIATSGDLVFLPKGKRYKMRYTAPQTTFVLVNFDLTREEGREVLYWEDIQTISNDSGHFGIAKVMTRFEQCSASKNATSLFRRKELFFRLLGTVFASPDVLSPEREDSAIIEGVRLLEQTYLEDLPISTFAEASHIGINRFRALFRAQFGISPVKYRNRLRIERARELLSEPDVTILEVAYACGFENVGYFCRAYRQETGERPGETKKRNR